MGGDFLVRFERMVEYIRMLKENFGKDFYIYFYIIGVFVIEKVFLKFYDVGLDEIRFYLDLFNLNLKFFKVEIENIWKVFDFDWDVGGEIFLILG